MNDHTEQVDMKVLSQALQSASQNLNTLLGEANLLSRNANRSVGFNP